MMVLKSFKCIYHTTFQEARNKSCNSCYLSSCNENVCNIKCFSSMQKLIIERDNKYCATESVLLHIRLISDTILYGVPFRLMKK